MGRAGQSGEDVGVDFGEDARDVLPQAIEAEADGASGVGGVGKEPLPPADSSMNLIPIVTDLRRGGARTSKERSKT